MDTVCSCWVLSGGLSYTGMHIRRKRFQYPLPPQPEGLHMPLKSLNLLLLLKIMLLLDHLLLRIFICLISSFNLAWICLFVCMEFNVPLENFSVIWWRHHYRLRTANFKLCSTLIAIEQWGFFSVPHLTVTRSVTLYWPSTRNRDTNTYCRAFSSSAVTSCFYDIILSRPGCEHTTFCLRGQRSNPLRHRHRASSYKSST